MYLNCRIKIPDTGGKITIKFVSGTSYVYLEQGRIYDKPELPAKINTQSGFLLSDRINSIISSAVLLPE